MITQNVNALYHQCISDFELRSPQWTASEPADLLAQRTKAFERFRELGFPSTQVEDWKYTNLTPFLKEQFHLAGEDGDYAVNKELVEKGSIHALNSYRIVLVNGRYDATLSDVIPGDAVQVIALKDAFNRPSFKSHFGKYIDVTNNHFAALNTALFRDGLLLEVKSKAVVNKPIHIIHAHSADDNLFIQPRLLYVVGAHAEVSIIESYVNNGTEHSIFVNSASEIVLGENAHVQHYYIQTGHERARYVQHTQIHQQTSSIYNNYKASFPGTGLLRNNLNVVLDGENIESHLYGVYLAGGHQLVDNHTLVDHRKPHCQSNELYRGVMKDEASGVFNGKIFVRKPAQKTNAFQQNNNLMLSKKAVVDSKPQLEIFADDVKCSHGSTVGQFNNEALFYLKSRGIGEEKARALLIHAFAFDVTEKIPLPEVKSHINVLIEEGLNA